MFKVMSPGVHSGTFTCASVKLVQELTLLLINSLTGLYSTIKSVGNPFCSGERSLSVSGAAWWLLTHFVVVRNGSFTYLSLKVQLQRELQVALQVKK